MDDSAKQWHSVVARPLDVEAFVPPSAAATLEIAAASVCGKRSRHNTDHFLALRLARTQETVASSIPTADLPPRFEECAYAMVVADGLGEQGAGARASRIALSALAHLAIQYGQWNVRVSRDTMVDIADQGEFFYRRVNDAMIRATHEDPQLADMASSLTSMYVAGAHLFFAHVGHSKAYLFRAGELIQLTIDHTLAQQLQTATKPQPLENPKKDFTHVVTESIGRRTDLDVEVEHVALISGDRLVLCSNGLTDVLSESEIADVLALQRSPADDCRRLIDIAMAGDAADDVTVMVADYRMPRPSGPSEAMGAPYDQQ